MNSKIDFPINLVTKLNIDCKKVRFAMDSPLVGSMEGSCFDPELIIIKNNEGRKIFNKIAKSFDWREKGIRSLPESTQYPCYILSMEVIAAGIRFGDWRMYENLEELAIDIDLDTATDDFKRFKQDVLLIFNQYL
jgi:hypothetical protein